MIRVVAILALASCYLDRVPVTDAIARASTYRVEGRGARGEVVTALAWILGRDGRELVTSAEFCDRVVMPSVVAHGRAYAAPARTSSRHPLLCLLGAPVALGPSLVVSRTWPTGGVRGIIAPGAPIWTRHGAVGVVVAVDDCKVTLRAALAELRSFARDMDVEIDQEPHVEDLAWPEFGCASDAKAHHMCGPPEEWR